MSLPPVSKVLFIRRAGAFGGIEVLLLDWIGCIDYGVNEVAIASTLDCFSGRIREQRLPVVCRPAALPVVGTFQGIFRSWFGTIRGLAPDKVVILQSNVTEVPVAAVLAAYVATRGNVYMTEHVAWPFPPEKRRSVHFGFLPGLGLWWYRVMWGARIRGRLARRVLAVSAGVKDLLLSYGYPERKVAVAYHGVDTDRFAPSGPARTRWRGLWKIPEDATVVVSTSRLAPEKRLERLIRAFDALARHDRNLWLLFAGDGPLRAELEASAAASGSGERVRFLGLAEDVAGVLQASDIFVLPSDREGLSVSLTEAMATGLLCVATDVSGSNEIVRDGENGVLVAPSEEGVRGGLRRVLALDRAARNRMGRYARETIVERFEKRRSVRRILGLLELESAPEAP